jgi:ferredoxin/flavodoxin---NADP+ reductase
MSLDYQEQVVSVRHWTDRLFSFTTTRPAPLRFESGQFTMLGLEVAGRPLRRAYSFASANYAEELEFFSIKVPDGPLTSRLQYLAPGDRVLIGRKATGTLLVQNLTPGGRRLYLLATGTGLAPFLSLLRDPDVWAPFESVVLVHGCRHAQDLAYREWLQAGIADEPLVGEYARERFRYLPTVTREPFATRERITSLIERDWRGASVDLPRLDPVLDRVMVCGNPAMLADLRALLAARGFTEGTTKRPGELLFELAFAER